MLSKFNILSPIKGVLSLIKNMIGDKKSKMSLRGCGVLSPVPDDF